MDGVTPGVANLTASSAPRTCSAVNIHTKHLGPWDGSAGTLLLLIAGSLTLLCVLLNYSFHCVIFKLFNNFCGKTFLFVTGAVGFCPIKQTCKNGTMCDFLLEFS